MVLRPFLTLTVAALLALAGCAAPDRETAPRRDGVSAQAPPRNIILMVSDGAGYSTLRATRLWSGRPLAVDARGWLHAPMVVAQLSTRTAPVAAPEGLAQDAAAEFDPARSCDATPAGGTRGGLYGLTTSYPRGVAGYEWHRDSAPDSANSMSALMTGQRSYNNAINVDGAGAPLRTLAQAAAASGRAVGVVTTADITDATPAAGAGARNPSRNDRAGIGAEMFGRGPAVVLGGAGNPDWTNDAAPRMPAVHARIDAATWAALKPGAPVGGPGGPVWTLVEDAADIRAMASGAAPVPDRLAMIARADQGLHQYRGGGLGPSTDAPFATPLVSGQPALADMARVALRRLDREPGGFVLVIEESNTDRAAHANHLGRVIEARLSFEDTLRAVLAWLDAPGSRASRADTLILVTADHDHLLLGPQADRAAFEAVQPDGPDPDSLPDHRWLWNGHSNFPVPLFVRGPGAAAVLAATASGQALGGRAAMVDQPCALSGPMLDQAQVGRALLALVDAPRR